MNSVDFKQFAEEQGFQHHVVTPKRPKANSEVERLMSTIGNAYERARRTNPGKWRETIINAVKALRATPHRVTGISPF